MPRSSEDEAPPRRSRRAGQPKANYFEGDAPNDRENDDEDASVPSSEAEEDESMDVEEEEEAPRKKGKGRSNSISRRSGRSTKYSASMQEPPQGLGDLFGGKMDDDSDDNKPKQHKSPARRHVQRRRSLGEELTAEASSDEGEDLAEDEEEEEEPLKVQRIVASRTETKQKWRELGKKMNTSEIHYGSRWYQAEPDPNDDTFEERFLVKWSDLSFLHVSWESRPDLVDQADARTYLTTFFRKAQNGLLYSPDERCDGDYFDPAFCQIERILEVQLPEGYELEEFTIETEDTVDETSFGMIFDKADKKFDEGTGRQFLIKWSNLPYSESTYEFERDLIMNEVEYKDHVKLFLKRNQKQTRTERRAFLKEGEAEYKRLYNFFGDRSKLPEDERKAAVNGYQTDLEELVYKNGGQLRDYQAEGVAWMISNFVNKRSCILADEMGLGKTLQTAATANILATKMNRLGPVLIVAPLSTLVHWKREFEAWTDLNTVVYHGSYDDRILIREHEFVYEQDRPAGAIGFNQRYLQKCVRKKKSKADSPWMIDVVITTPEMMVCDDSAGLASVEWELLVVDEAHRLKNYSSKLAICLRNDKFQFRHRILLTGTPIQNDVQEFWTLLNFINPGDFCDLEEFMEKYGAMQSKESIDELHEEIRPYILRRLKEDVEKSVPPKEETLIEVELTVAQKKYYRALYEKNVKFLHKNKSKALDGPSLNNLAMQLRKCCNHLFLLNGIEEEFRSTPEGSGVSEGDLLAKTSGKLVLLDKLLPRLKEEGHRVLLFSQFKIMLDILEDYLSERQMKFERIDGSITGNKRQQAIDRFQAPGSETNDPPFVMMLSTRAGGVGINLTAADTCIIFDSDWNPQNDLQAQARCHRIGQTKSVKVYRLLTRKTYEMQMFHMSSLKMGLDQAVLKGFESGAAGNGALSKDEVEKLLRHGAYDIFNEENAGEGEKASNDFVEQDIDSILQRHSRTVVHDNTGSKSNAAGGTFSKASFTLKSPDASGKKGEDVDIEDPDFWKKMIDNGDYDEPEKTPQKRERVRRNYSEREYSKQLDEALYLEEKQDADSFSNEEDDDEMYDEGHIRLNWGGPLSDQWKKEDADVVVRALCTFGYSHSSWEDLMNKLELKKTYTVVEFRRMAWAIVMVCLLDHAEENGEHAKKALQKAAEKRRSDGGESKPEAGGALAVDRTAEPNEEEKQRLKVEAFEKLVKVHGSWLHQVFVDAVSYAKDNEPRNKETLDLINRKPSDSKKPPKPTDTTAIFATNVWPSLKSRGWKSVTKTEGPLAGKTLYSFEEKEHSTVDAVLETARKEHPELEHVFDSVSASTESTLKSIREEQEKERLRDLSLGIETASNDQVLEFLRRYGPIQLIADRTKVINRIKFPFKKLFTLGLNLYKASTLVQRARQSVGKDESSVDVLAASLNVRKTLAVPHPLWTTKHDSVLLHAIAKHGWIDYDNVAGAISGDPSIKWGPPFDSLPEEIPGQSRPGSNDAPVLATAQRAASFLNEHHEFVVNELKGFNRDRLVRTCGLIRKQHGTPSMSVAGQPWVVDEPTLRASGILTAGEGPTEPIDLPPKRELVRRAGAVLSREDTTTADQANEIPKAKRETAPKTAYTELDQTDGANILLVELLRALLKEVSTSKQIKKLCGLIYDEVHRRVDHMLLLSATDASLSMATEDLKKISAHIDIVRWNLNGSAVQYKNIVRVILGEEAKRPRKEGESLFPPERNYAALELTKKKGRGQTNGVKASDKTDGERSIDQGRKRLVERYSSRGGPAKPFADIFELTEIETLVLTTACAVGIPVWSPTWSSSLHQGSDLANMRVLTWKTFGQYIVSLAKKSLDRAREKLRKAKRDLEKMEGSNRGRCIAAVEAAEELKRSTGTVHSQAVDYYDEPENLAKKSVMLLSKIRQVMSKQAPVGPGLGLKVLEWMEKELFRWSESLELIDRETGKPYAFFAVEFLDDLPETERGAIEVHSLFDRLGCRSVISQAAMMTRLRSISNSCEGPQLWDNVVKAVQNLTSVGLRWDQKPVDWAVDKDFVLAGRLLQFGLTDKLIKSAGMETMAQIESPTFQSMKLTKAALHTRANQLVRQLHLTDTKGILEERSNGDDAMIIDLTGTSKRTSTESSAGSASKKNRLS